MALDAICLAAVVEELRSAICGGRIDSGCGISSTGKHRECPSAPLGQSQPSQTPPYCVGTGKPGKTAYVLYAAS